jgi:Phytanoyl-CoA dioxygenase (PhyH)
MTLLATMPARLEAQFAELGVAIVEYALTRADLAAMDELFPRLDATVAGARTHEFKPQAREWLSRHPALNSLAQRLAQPDQPSPVQLIRLQAFDKSSTANWFVPWHQDRAKDGTERPLAALAQTVALRIHLDDCGDDNGPLEVIPGSHKSGRLDQAQIARISQHTAPLLCLAARGDIVAMRPLLVHRSQRARVPQSRRVLHLEFVPQSPRQL